MDIQQDVEALKGQLQAWRRDFHKHAESGFLEMRTASIVAAYLEKLGYEVKAGHEVMNQEARMGVPSVELLQSHELWALEHGANEKWLAKLSGGMTGVVGILDTGRPGPVTAFRVDMDALDIQEDLSAGHLPFDEGFASMNDNMMHACGHDGHTAIGLGLATLLMKTKEKFSGVFKLIFQPAEEGTRGAKSMAEAGVVDDADYFIATHLGTGVPAGEVVAGNAGFLATTKMDVTFKGKAAHAGSEPNEGKNALMAASTAVLGLYGIPRHAAGDSRVNVGVMQAGSGRNIIPSQAFLKVETRGETSEINDYIREQALAVINGAATMYQTEAEVVVVGEAMSSKPSPELVELVAKASGNSPYVQSVKKLSEDSAGSEDATYFMERVKEKGGQATYVIVGTTLAAGHHNERFDYDEEVLPTAVDVLYRVAQSLMK